MKNIKVIIMDVDGTLLNSQKKISPATQAALLMAQAKGIRLILASGRPTSGLLQLGKDLAMDKNNGLFVSYNGSRVVDIAAEKTLFNHPLSVNDGKAVLEHMKNFSVYPMIDKDGYMYVNNVFAPPIHLDGKAFNVIEYEARGGGFMLCEKEDLTVFLDYEVNKILTAGEPEYLQRVHKEMMEPFKDSLSCMFTSPFFFEFTARGIDKARALDQVLRPMGYIPEEMISFGDGMNDLSMIHYTGTGVAMANAVPDLKAAADYITASNDDDGIAKALYHYIPELNQPL